MKFRELPSTIVGQVGEQIVARQYKRDGWGVIMSCKFSGENDNEAPAIEIEDGAKEITPDLDVSKGGQRIWIEVKTHAIAALNGALSRGGPPVYTHGIPVRLFDNYVAVEQRSGNPVYLAIVQLDTREILVSPLPISKMMKFPCLCGGCKSTPRAQCSAGDSRRYPQWYFNRDDFEVRGHVDDRTFKILDEKHRALKSHVLRRHGADRAASAAGVFSPAKPPWTWACLACNAAGTGPSSAHRCDPRTAINVSAMWSRRLGFALPDLTAEQRAALLAKPIERTSIVEWFGASWSPQGDVR